MVFSLERASESPGNLKAAHESRPSAQSALQGVSLRCFLLPSWAPAGVLLVPAPGQEPSTGHMKSEMGDGLGGGMGRFV